MLTLGFATRHESLARQAYAAVRGAIRSGLIVPGVFYSEPLIARALRVSRTPVREALIELAREGVIEKVPQRGFRLRPVKERELEEVYQLRSLLESYVVRRLATVGNSQQLAVLQHIIQDQAAASSDPAAFLDLDERFHLTMARSLGLEHTHAMLLSLRSIMLVAGAVTLWHPQRTQEVLQEHQAVLDRLAGHDRQGAVHAIRDHIEATRRAASGALQMGSPNIAASQQYSEVATDDRSITASLVRG